MELTLNNSRLRNVNYLFDRAFYWSSVLFIFLLVKLEETEVIIQIFLIAPSVFSNVYLIKQIVYAVLIYNPNNKNHVLLTSKR